MLALHVKHTFLGLTMIRRMENIAERIKEARLLHGKTQLEIAKACGVSKAAVGQWEAGLTVPTGPNLVAAALFLKVRPEWLATGSPPRQATSRRAVPLVGYVGAGGEVYPVDDHAKGAGLEEIPGPVGYDGDCVALRVRGNSMYPALEDGWIIYYTRNGDGVPQEAIGRLCVVKAAGDGPMMVKKLHRAPGGKFRLDSTNAPPMDDVTLEWAAPVLGIRPT